MIVQSHQDVCLSGDHVISNIAAARQSLLDAFAFGGSIDLDLSDLGQIDVTFLQLMVAAARTARQTETTLTFSNPPAALTLALERAGIDLAGVSTEATH